MDAIQEIFQSSYTEYCRDHAVPRHQHRAARNIIRCRTGFFGVRMERCPKGHVERLRYNACHHRSCPQCNGQPREQWLNRTLPRLLPTPHRHIIFTIDHALLPLYQWNREQINHLLFQSAWKTLQQFSLDSRYLGAKPGALLALHSWGRNLSLHPHIHALMTEGGLDVDGNWVTPNRQILFPIKAVIAVYRGKMISGLRKLYKQRELRLPPDMGSGDLSRLLDVSYRKSWNVRIEPGYAHGWGLLKYLGRYVRGGPIRAKQLRLEEQGSNGMISFRYKDHRGGKRRTMVLSRESFIGRLLQHIPPSNQPTVRYYGLYGNRSIAELKEANKRIRLLSSGCQWVDKISGVIGFVKEQNNHCPTCGAELEIEVRRGRYRPVG